MRQEKVSEAFSRENRRLEQRILSEAVAAMHSGTMTAGPHVPTPLDDAHRVVELERARLEHRPSARRNDPPAELAALPTWKAVEASRRWGSPPPLPAPPPVVQPTSEQMQEEILALRERQIARQRENKADDARVAELAAQLAALGGR